MSEATEERLREYVKEESYDVVEDFVSSGLHESNLGEVFEAVTAYRNIAEDLEIENDLTRAVKDNYKELLTSYASERPADFIESVLSMSDESFEVESEEDIKISLPQYPTLEDGVEVESHVNHGYGMKFVPNEEDEVKHLKNLVAIPVSMAFEEVLRPERSRRRTTEKDKNAVMNMIGF